jgi:hypothetical protein
MWLQLVKIVKSSSVIGVRLADTAVGVVVMAGTMIPSLLRKSDPTRVVTARGVAG